MINQEKINKRKVKDTFEWEQVEFLMNLELKTGIALKKRYSISFIKDKAKRENILRSLLKIEIGQRISSVEEMFYEHMLSIDQGEFQAISLNSMFTGIEIITSTGMILPLLIVETINKTPINWSDISNSYNYEV